MQITQPHDENISPTCRFFNASIAENATAIDSVREQFANPGDRVTTVRQLSTLEVATLNLKVGETAPA